MRRSAKRHLKRFYVRHIKRHLQGLDITQAKDQSQTAPGQLLTHVRVKRWYLPVLLLRGLREQQIPRRYWPVLFWRVYVSQSKKRGT